MKKVVCNNCGSQEAADFVFRVLCPEKGCVNYDRKLADERAQEDTGLEIDFYTDGEGNCYISDITLDDLLADLDADLDDD